ncbi:MAG: phospholipase D-like domain-containing protein [Nocardioidaceae bacterium]
MSDHGRRTRRLLRVLVAALAVPAATLGPAPARAAFVPPAGPLFNDPLGDPTAQLRIEHRLDTMIGNTPAGATIRVATLGLNIDSTTQALVAAHRRGVVVKMVLPKPAVDSPDVAQMAQELGTDTSRPSYLATCNLACYSDDPRGAMHAKIYMFSRTGDARDVTTFSSANMTQRSVSQNWNDAYTFVGRGDVYSSTRRYYDGLHRDISAPPRPVANLPGVQLLFFPDPVTGKSDDFFSRVFANTECKGAAPGSGSHGHTVIRFASSLWRGNRADVARRLVRLSDRGCNVELLLQVHKTDPKILTTLLQGQVRMRRTDEDGRAVNNHSKFIAISGVHYGRRGTNTVYTGSLNVTLNGTRYSDDHMLRVLDRRTVYAAYARRFATIWARSQTITAADLPQARRPTSVPDEMADG